jgi:polyisoprenoid-binding protein YceI
VSRYELVPASSWLSIHARSSTHPIDVEAAGVEGAFDAGPGDAGVMLAAPGELTVDVSRLRSGSVLVDRETHRRLDLRRHPRITARLDQAVPTPAEGSFRCEGTITLLGVERPAHGDLTVQVNDDGSLLLTGEQRFDVRDWGIEPPRLLVLRVHPEVRVRLRALARPAVGPGH